MKNTNIIKEHWNGISDKYYEGSEGILEKVIKNPECAFPGPVLSFIKRYFAGLDKKRICVPSSGDNMAVFAFHLMGASVTSVDISEKQVMNARNIAEKRGWDIEFVCDDSMELSRIKSGEYDLVYTSNGVHVWISDLSLMYQNFNRILKDNGYYIFFETHPMIRPFDDSGENVKIVKHYGDIGPHGEVPTYAWRMQDFANSLIFSGFTIEGMEEFHSSAGDLLSYDYMYKTEEERLKDNYRLYDWKQNPWAALPQCFALCSKRRNTL